MVKVSGQSATSSNTRTSHGRETFSSVRPVAPLCITPPGLRQHSSPTSPAINSRPQRELTHSPPLRRKELRMESFRSQAWSSQRGPAGCFRGRPAHYPRGRPASLPWRKVHWLLRGGQLTTLEGDQLTTLEGDQLNTLEGGQLLCKDAGYHWRVTRYRKSRRTRRPWCTLARTPDMSLVAGDIISSDMDHQSHLADKIWNFAKWLRVTSSDTEHTSSHICAVGRTAKWLSCGDVGKIVKSDNRSCEPKYFYNYMKNNKSEP